MTQQNATNPEALFNDADELLALALKHLAEGDIRDAAEKAWGATMASANGLLLARTGEKPTSTYATRRALMDEAHKHSEVEGVFSRFMIAQGALHGGCFYDGMCEPREAIESRIRKTEQLIRDARALAR